MPFLCNMYTGLLHLHNLLRWVIIILLVVAIIRHLRGMMNNKPLTAGDKRNALILMISAHIQLLTGIYEWFFGAFGLKLIRAAGMGVVMKNAAMRFWAIEHITGMLIAITLITLGRSVSKKPIPDQTKHSRMFWFFFVAFILIIASVPWPFREAIARPLFPGMK
jgi:hypothetical protein